MKTAGEIVIYLNESSANVYELSESLGLARTTLRARLIQLGYEKNIEGIWEYTGDSDKEPIEVDIVTRNRIIKTKQPNNALIEFKRNPHAQLNIHEALMQLDLAASSERTTISLQPEYLHAMKELAAKTRLRLSDLYTLAIYELLEKYHLKR